jgi:uncharacterized repeat protein (TIGR03803 family)
MMNRKHFQNRMFNLNSQISRALLALIFVLVLTAMLAQRAQAQTYTVLYTFTGGTDGGWPYSGVILDDAGNLYGTTETRGNVKACGAFHGCGVVYKLDTSGNETVLHTFEGNLDGRQPQWGNLFRDNAGNLWDTTLYGGTKGDLGLGVVYKLTASGKETILHRFAGGPNDGEEPQTGFIQDKDGTFYGTTAAGGSGPYGDCGTVFKMSQSGKVTILHSFVVTDGCQPIGGLVVDAAGNMYGVTSTGGSDGYGVVYKITKAGKVTVLHSFAGQPDGAYPLGILAIDKAGNLYGTTPGGGDPNCTTEQQGCGIVFEIDTHGKEHILHSFLAPEGGLPYAGVVLDAAGNIYGSTSGFSTYNFGSIFKLDKQGNFTKLHDFTGGADGGFPFSAMTLDKSGTFYGTTYLGGLADGCDYNQGCGVVFKLTP